MGYGQVVRWLQANTTTVPTPLSREIKDKQIVNNLNNWIIYFDEANFKLELKHKNSGGEGGSDTLLFIGQLQI